MVPRLPVLCSAVLACSGGGMDTSGDSVFSQREVQHFRGSSTWLSPQGESISAPGQVWLRRDLRPDSGQVVEDLISVDGAGQRTMYRVEISIEGDQFSGRFEESGGTVQITGQLIGTPWEWESWSATGVYTDGSLEGYYFRSEAVLGASGLALDKRVYDASDVYLLHIIEELSLVDGGTWEADVEGLKLSSQSDSGDSGE